MHLTSNNNCILSLNLNDLWKINLQTVNNLFWEKVEPKGKSPVARHGHTKVCLNNFLIIFGGRGDNDVYLNDVVVFDTTKLEWYSMNVKAGYTL
jgi:N-acetylneuraminic acid mutarotase